MLGNFAPIEGWALCKACMCAKSLQSCLTLCSPMDCSPTDSSVHGILQAGPLEWVAMPSSRGSSQPRDQTHVSLMSPALAGGFFTTSATWEAHCARCFMCTTSQGPKWQFLYPCFKKEEMDSERLTQSHMARMESNDNNGNQYNNHSQCLYSVCCGLGNTLTCLSLTENHWGFSRGSVVKNLPAMQAV